MRLIKDFLFPCNRLSVSHYSLFLILFLLCSCSQRKTGYVFHDNIAPLERYDEVYALSTDFIKAKVDILMVVDNSGSMANINQNIDDNAHIFFNTFIERQDIDWRLGIISVGKSKPPFLGFVRPFGSSVNDSENRAGIIVQFRDAFSLVRSESEYNEYVFYNVERVLMNERYSGFRREDAYLIVIMITDEKEHSAKLLVNQGDDYYDADVFLNRLSNQLNTKIDKIRFYGVLEAVFYKNLGLDNCDYSKGTTYRANPIYGNCIEQDICRGSFGDNIAYSISQYKKIIEATNGKVVSGCDQNFGEKMAMVGDDIASFVAMTKIPLERRPKLDTLEIYYGDELIIPGRSEDGGMWFYEETSNSINLYNTGFMSEVKGYELSVKFDIDDGINRNE